MIVSGLWLLVFIVIHVKAFKYGTEYQWPAKAAGISIASRWRTSRNPLMVAFYVLSMLVVGSHLWHGVVERVSVARPRSSALDAAHARHRKGRWRC